MATTKRKTDIRTLRRELSENHCIIYRQGGQWILGVWCPSTRCHHEHPMHYSITTERQALESALGKNLD